MDAIFILLFRTNNLNPILFLLLSHRILSANWITISSRMSMVVMILLTKGMFHPYSSKMVLALIVNDLWHQIDTYCK